MSNNITSGQINDMAQKIANLLDSKEETEATRGNGTIEASIWNKFVGEGQPEDKQVGNGEKSKIKSSIAMNNAVSSIASYIKTKGTAAIANALKQLGIDWKPDIEVKAGTVTRDEKSTKSNSSFDKESQNLIKKAKRENEEYKAGQAKAKANAEEAKKKYEAAKKIAQSAIDKETNMTYEQAENTMKRIRNDMPGKGTGFVADKKHPYGHAVTYTDAEVIQQLEWLCKSPAYASQSAKFARYITEAKKAHKAKQNLEAKYPDLKNMDKLAQEANYQPLKLPS